jgi:hypothetical protein
MGSKNKPNGHGALLAQSSRANVDTISLSGMGQAASVDASELPVAQCRTFLGCGKHGPQGVR